MANFIFINTRPQPDNAALEIQLAQENIASISLPALKIMPILLSENLKILLANLSQFDIAIFVSKPAARFFIEYKNQINFHLPKNLRIAAIGKGTENILVQNKIPVHVSTSEKANSEILLIATALTQVANKSIALFSGEAGRDLIETSLKNRGAKVVKIPLYKRVVNQAAKNLLQQTLSQNLDHIILASSIDSLFALRTLAGNQLPCLFKQKLIAVSERIAIAAKSMGFTNEVILAQNADNDSIIHALKDLDNKI